ncbi:MULTISPECIES: hypothetical protein [Clostridium]|uniref:hypothetical protein n=1 Tax=Clostridium TaxID=1485 RepID=UPI0008246200|nr:MULTISPECIES: hypothetical protein [Clostridium]PJI09587.1 hypothetical protein CUB90_17695 [Clostridium sp. CT7]
MKNSSLKLLTKLVYFDLCLQVEQNMKLDFLKNYNITNIPNGAPKNEENITAEWTSTLQAIRDYSFNEKRKKLVD